MCTRISKETSSDPEIVIDDLVRGYFKRLEAAVFAIAPNLLFLTKYPDANITGTEQQKKLTMNDLHHVVKTLLSTREFVGLGLHFGSRLKLVDYGLSGAAVASCATFDDAMRLEFSHTGMLVPDIELVYDSYIENDRVVINITETHPERWPEHYLIEMEIACVMGVISELLPTVDIARLCRVTLAYSRPAHWRLYRQILSCPVKFNQPVTQLSFPTSWLSVPLKNALPALSKILDMQCQEIITRMGNQGDLVDATRRLLHQAKGKPPSLEQAALNLEMPVHTFRRHLYQAGTSYKYIVYSVRMELATDYLRLTLLSLNEIAFLLGYEYESNFCTAFKKYVGVSPMTFRLNNNLQFTIYNLQ